MITSRSLAANNTDNGFPFCLPSPINTADLPRRQDKGTAPTSTTWYGSHAEPACTDREEPEEHNSPLWQ
jgi:hypothetical protein